MPETPEQLYERAAGALRTPEYLAWPTFPFGGDDVRVRDLQPPLDTDPRRGGAGGVDCRTCAATDDGYLWVGETWRLRALRPSGLPLVLMLETRAHHAEPGDLPDDLAAEQGVMIARVERAMRSMEGIGRVHISRWGDGGEHLHWWFLARPERMLQLCGTFAAIWDDILPVTPDDIWQANVRHVAERLAAER